jgi:hypothetical protein
MGIPGASAVHPRNIGRVSPAHRIESLPQSCEMSLGHRIGVLGLVRSRLKSSLRFKTLISLLIYRMEQVGSLLRFRLVT